MANNRGKKGQGSGKGGPWTAVDAKIEKNGDDIKLIVRNDRGEEIVLSFDKDSLTSHIASLTELAIRAAETRTNGISIPLSSSGPTQVDFLPITDIGLAMTASQKYALVLRMYDFDLNYTLTEGGLKSIATSFSQAVQALGADQSVSN